MITTFVIVSATIGLYNSIYFTLLSYRLISPAAPVVPAVCRLDEVSCGTVVHTRQAKLFAGLPNALLGCLYYCTLIAAAGTGLLWHTPYLTVFIVVAAVTVAVGVYLTHQLYAVLKARCPLCIVSHIINAILFVLLVTSAKA